jgi:hypothetical protein
MTACTTLNRIRKHRPCKSGWEKLLRHLGKSAADNELVPFSVIVESNGLNDALWCCCSVDYDRVWRMYAVWCARQVEHLMKDQRSKDALDIAERYAQGNATDEELNVARAAAWDVARAAAGDAAGAAAWDVARAAAGAAAWDGAGDAAGDGAWYAAWAPAEATQKAMFLRVVACASEDEAVEMLRKEMHP